MLKIILITMLPLLTLFSDGSDRTSTKAPKAPEGSTGTLEKTIVASGNVTLDIDMNRLNGAGKKGKAGVIRFDVERNAFFTTMIFNDEVRAQLPGTMGLIPQGGAVAVPSRLKGSFQNLVIERLPFGSDYELVVRDAKSGFTFFNIDAVEFDYNSDQRTLATTGRVLISREFADEMGRQGDAGVLLGQISIKTNIRAVEITDVVDGEVKSETMPGIAPESGTTPGPDVIVGDLTQLAQFGSSSGTQVGLAIGTDSCNAGTENLHWFANPQNDHPVIPQNLYRMSGGASNNERFEQIGQSQVKHAFTALTENICSFGCNNVGGANLGSGCSDPYTASLNSGPNLGSKAFINPFTGAYPRNDGATPNNNHSGHTHNGTTHRILTEIADLNTSLNAGATYWGEGQYVTPHEYAWCQTNPTQCNMNNNVSSRQFSVSGTTSPFSFGNVGSTQRMKPAVANWTGSTQVTIRPDATNDGVGVVAYKVTNPSAGVWHYEYAVYNQNMDRGIQSFSIPLGNGVTLSNVGFHAPPQHPGSANDGTLGSAGFSSTPWAQSQAGGAMTWSSETFAQNQNANALRWGTLYNFRFDSNQPPQATSATIGFYKTGAPITVAVQGPSAATATSFSISGRVLNSDGLPLRNAIVTISNGSGLNQTFTTGSFGAYSFEGLPIGPTYTINASAKRNRFTAATMTPSSNVTSFDLQANAEGRLK